MRISVIGTCIAALALASSASAQGRPAARQPAPAATINPALALPANMPKSATDPAMLLAQINALAAKVSALESQLAAAQQQNAAQEARIVGLTDQAAKLQSAYAAHRHQLVKVGPKTILTQTCSYAGGYPHCETDKYPGVALVTDGQDAWKTTSPPVP